MLQFPTRNENSANTLQHNSLAKVKISYYLNYSGNQFQKCFSKLGVLWCTVV